jgi:Bacterial Ig-like domain (group 1)
MQTRQPRNLATQTLLGLALAATVALGGCKSDAVEVPVLTGPSGLALQFLMTANPDLVVTNSTSAIGVTLRDRNGRPIANQQLLFLLDSGPGSIDKSIVVTDSNGGASVTYTADSPGVASISSRPIGLDFSGTDVFRRVTVQVASPI